MHYEYAKKLEKRFPKLPTRIDNDFDKPGQDYLRVWAFDNQFIIRGNEESGFNITMVGIGNSCKFITLQVEDNLMDYDSKDLEELITQLFSKWIPGNEKDGFFSGNCR